MDYAEFAQNLAERYPSLSPQLRLAARHVLDRPDDVALMSMRGIAADAGVHPTTLTRLARALDFGTYEAFRAMFQKRLRSQPADFLGRAQELRARASGKEGGVVSDVLEAAIGNLEESFTANGVERFAACAEALRGGNRIFVAGQRSCYPIAFYFNYVYSVFRNNAVLMDGGGGTFSDGLRSLGRGDVIFAISFDPYTLATVQAVDFALENGGSAVVLTDSMVSPLIDRADHSLIIKNESPSFFQSAAPAMAAVEVLIALMVLGDGAQALGAIEESEKQLRRFEAYWAQPAQGKPRRKTK